MPKDFFEQSYPMLLNVELVGPTEQKLNDIEAPGGAKNKKRCQQENKTSVFSKSFKT